PVRAAAERRCAVPRSGRLTRSERTTSTLFRYQQAREAAMAFRGWPVEALEFFEGLEEDNSKAYWQRNKDVYERLVRSPMEELLAELEPQWGKGHIFRPYRDVRFSKDKSPYKTNI